MDDTRLEADLATRIVGARTPMRRQLLARVDAIVGRAAAAQAAGLRGWDVHAVLTDARVPGSRGHVVALVARLAPAAPALAGPRIDLPPASPWTALRAVGLRVVAEEWAVATVVADVETRAPVLAAPAMALIDDDGLDELSA
jgi:hypothetical protein